MSGPGGDNSMKIAEVLDEASFVRPRAQQTLRIYGRSLRRFAAAGLGEVDAVTVEALRVAIDRRLEEVQPQTAAVDCVALFAALAHLERTGRFALEQLRALRRLRPEVRLPELLSAEWLTRDQVDELAIAAREQSSLVELTVLVASLSGLRAGELARLAWRDVDVPARVLRVRGRTKTRRERVVPLCAPLVAVMREHPGACFTRDNGAGLLLGCGRTLSAGVVSRRCLRLAQRTGLRCSLLLLRHTRASWWVQEGVPLVKVAAWLGNSPEVVARHYAGLLAGYDPDVERGPERKPM